MKKLAILILTLVTASYAQQPGAQIVNPGSSGTGTTGKTPLVFTSASISPANATTYYIGAGSLAPATANTSEIAVAAPIGCTVSGGSYSTLVTGTKDTAANNITLKVYDLTTATAFTDTAGVLTEVTNTQHTVTFAGAADAVSAGDQLLIQLVTPTFTTLPVNVYFAATIFCQ